MDKKKLWHGDTFPKLFFVAKQERRNLRKFCGTKISWYTVYFIIVNLHRKMIQNLFNLKIQDNLRLFIAVTVQLMDILLTWVVTLSVPFYFQVVHGCGCMGVASMTKYLIFMLNNFAQPFKFSAFIIFYRSALGHALEAIPLRHFRWLRNTTRASSQEREERGTSIVRHILPRVLRAVKRKRKRDEGRTMMSMKKTGRRRRRRRRGYAFILTSVTKGIHMSAILNHY